MAVAQTVYLRSHYLSIAPIEGVHERAASVADHLTGLPPSIDECLKMKAGERKRLLTKARKHAISVIDSFAKRISMTEVELAKHWGILKTAGKASDKGKPRGSNLHFRLDLCSCSRGPLASPAALRIALALPGGCRGLCYCGASLPLLVSTRIVADGALALPYRQDQLVSSQQTDCKLKKLT